MSPRPRPRPFVIVLVVAALCALAAYVLAFVEGAGSAAPGHHKALAVIPGRPLTTGPVVGSTPAPSSASASKTLFAGPTYPVMSMAGQGGSSRKHEARWS
jgi:hypothetical protein